ncbi:MAG: bifunctional diguanylate cyclase/phosphodiesterase [Zetaproteobacteria bacterium]|nr:MAG: bifunctional diguanylate cyclase/phosphodiesterase [Zetaproteobacteria bacterium]
MTLDLQQQLSALDRLRETTVLHVGNLLQRQQWNRNAFSRIVALVSMEHEAIGAALERLRRRVEDGEVRREIASLQARCSRLDGAVARLQRLRNRSSDREMVAIKKIIFSFDRAAGTLNQTLIDKNLLDRQNQVLENLIISHEHVANWKQFVQRILIDFHQMFRFDFFFIAFSEENELTLFFYYMGDYPEPVKEQIDTACARRVLAGLDLPPDTPYSVERFVVIDRPRRVDPTQVETITVKVPDYAPNLAGLLGATYASTRKVSVQEQAVIRSILSVMVMVVGSSKVLSRTLAELEFHSIHDPLTGLYNRRHFDEMLRYEVDRSERHRHHFSLLFLDSDDFKQINDGFGHPCGDQVLVELGGMMRAATRMGDLVVRLGGDEFAILLPETPVEGARALAEKLRKRISHHRFTSPDGRQFQTSVSIGIAGYPRDGRNSRDLLAACDAALYRAKEGGKNSIVVAAAQPPAARVRDARVAVERLRDALAEGRVLPYFQPILSTADRRPVACEVVARKQSRDGRVLPAMEFIETVERAGLARSLDRSIVDGALEVLHERMQHHPADAVPPLFINLSPQEIRGRSLLGFAEQRCAELGIPPEKVVFEMAERAVVAELGAVRGFLANLRNRGFRFALDDFGSGYNAFHYLRELRFDFVKIDGAFIRGVVDSQVDALLVRHLAAICRGLGMVTIAEHVEEEEIMAAVTEMGIDYAQGFHLGAPVSARNLFSTWDGGERR